MKREIPKLVTRRGQPFKIQLHCNRPYNIEKDAISLVFSVADVEKPSFGHGTLVACALKNKSTDLGKSTEWGTSVNAINSNILEILIKPAANCIVTQWKLDIDSKILDSTISKSYSLPQPFYVLFNPWCREDQVYLEDDRLRNEYVLSDTTLIWKGTYNRLRPTPWKLGQFERDVLDCALYVIAYVGKVGPTNRGNPIKISRALSAAVNRFVFTKPFSNDFTRKNLKILVLTMTVYFLATGQLISQTELHRQSGEDQLISCNDFIRRKSLLSLHNAGCLPVV